MKTKAIVLRSSFKFHSSFQTHHILILLIISCVPLNSTLYDCSYDKKTIKTHDSYNTKTACVVLLIYTWNLHSFCQSFVLTNLHTWPIYIQQGYKKPTDRNRLKQEAVSIFRHKGNTARAFFTVTLFSFYKNT